MDKDNIVVRYSDKDLAKFKKLLKKKLVKLNMILSSLKVLT